MEEIAADADGHRARLRAAIEAKLEGLHVSVCATSGISVHGVLTRADGRLKISCEGKKSLMLQTKKYMECLGVQSEDRNGYPPAN